MSVGIEGADNQLDCVPWIEHHVQQTRISVKIPIVLIYQYIQYNVSHTLEISRFFDPSLKVMFITDLKWFNPRHLGIVSNLVKKVNLKYNHKINNR